LNYLLIAGKKHELSETQVQLKVPNHLLMSDFITWWGSKEKLVARVLEQEKQSNYWYVPTRQDAGC